MIAIPVDLVEDLPLSRRVRAAGIQGVSHLEDEVPPAAVRRTRALQQAGQTGVRGLGAQRLQLVLEITVGEAQQGALEAAEHQCAREHDQHGERGERPERDASPDRRRHEVAPSTYPTPRRVWISFSSKGSSTLRLR